MSHIINVSASAVTSIGKVRQTNEDNFFVNNLFMPLDAISNSLEYTVKITGVNCLFAICDGMGGEQSGEVAAGISVRNLNTVWESMCCSNTSDVSKDKGRHQLCNAYEMRQHKQDLESALVTANDEICQYTRETKKKRVGCTFVSLSIINKQALITNIGDSRAYLFRGEHLTQLSTDHLQTRITESQMDKSNCVQSLSHKSPLTRYIGVFPDEMVIRPTFAEIIDLQNNDFFILCSDGLTDMVSDNDIMTIIRNHPINPSLALRDAALENGGKDNVTIICADVGIQRLSWLRGKINR